MRKEDALFRDRPRVVYHRIYFSIRKYSGEGGGTYPVLALLAGARVTLLAAAEVAQALRVAHVPAVHRTVLLAKGAPACQNGPRLSSVVSKTGRLVAGMGRRMSVGCRACPRRPRSRAAGGGVT